MTTKEATKATGEVQARETEATVWRRTLVPPADAYEARDTYILELELPGAEEKDIEVTAENGILTVRAVADTAVRGGMTVLREETPSRRWHRSFDLGDGIDVAGIRGKFSRGVLRLTLPKHETVKARKIAIDKE